MEVTQSVAEIFDTAGPTNKTSTFEQLSTFVTECKDRVLDRFELQVDPGTDPIATYGTPEGLRGELVARTGPEMDWMIHSWMGNPAEGFTNIHLTCWLGPHTNVPHFAMACGTLPSLWCFVDLLPRADLWTDLDYVDRFYYPSNDTYMALRNDPGAPAFVSQDTYTRITVSASAFCGVFDDTQDRVDLIKSLATERLDQWFGFLDDAPVVAPADRAPLAERDLAMRRNVAERDPANALAERFFGPELTEQLVRGLWGGDRQLPRPTGDLNV